MKQITTILITFCVLLITSQVKAQKDTLARLVSVSYGNNQVGENITAIDLERSHTTTLRYDQNYLQFGFVNTQNPRNKTFYYYLEGLDYSWIKCDDCSQAQYAHLNGGDYTFHVKTTEHDDVPIHFKFSIEGDIIHRWWFVPMLFVYAIGFVAIGLYFFVLYRFRLKLQQQRLIHTEKMASMAELTAGIAHEIQNPLNFVQNYTEVSKELVEDLLIEQNKNEERDQVYEAELLADLDENLTKILNHSSRADAIVKGMLQHSQHRTGAREYTDLNALTEEYLGLAYHGMQARNPDFKVTLRTELAENLPKVEVFAADIGRVILNLINNALYAVKEKDDRQLSGFLPEVLIRTHHQEGKVMVRITDNGDGIQDSIRDKIFQPFFTTKPAGEGTGLGLSLAYDIVKVHGGELKVECEVGAGTTFIVEIPIM